jgi:hypothetical protein
MSNTVEKVNMSEEEEMNAFLKGFAMIEKSELDEVFGPVAGYKERAITAISICVPDTDTVTEFAATGFYVASGLLNVVAWGAWGAYKGTELLAKGSKKAAKSLQKSSERQRERKQ